MTHHNVDVTIQISCQRSINQTSQYSFCRFKKQARKVGFLLADTPIIQLVPHEPMHKHNGLSIALFVLR